MTISRVTLVRKAMVVEVTTIDIEGPDDRRLRQKALARSKDLDLIWERFSTENVGKAAVDQIETLADGDETL